MDSLEVSQTIYSIIPRIFRGESGVREINLQNAKNGFGRLQLKRAFPDSHRKALKLSKQISCSMQPKHSEVSAAFPGA